MTNKAKAPLTAKDMMTLAQEGNPAEARALYRAFVDKAKRAPDTVATDADGSLHYYRGRKRLVPDGGDWKPANKTPRRDKTKKLK